jgi:CUG-BP- and ETR3-like factor
MYGAMAQQAALGGMGMTGAAAIGGGFAAPGANAPVNAEPKLFVGNLPGHTADADLRMLFQAYGTVLEVHLMNPSAKTGQRCAFIRYSSTQECQAAIDGLVNYRVHPSDEKPILVRFADNSGAAPLGGPPTGLGGAIPPPPPRPAGTSAAPVGAEPKLFVGNLPASTSEADLRMIFQTYGNVEDVHLMHPSAKTGQRCAFVRYGTPDECQAAIDGLASYQIMPGNNILVRFADSGGQKRMRMF